MNCPIQLVVSCIDEVFIAFVDRRPIAFKLVVRPLLGSTPAIRAAFFSAAELLCDIYKLYPCIETLHQKIPAVFKLGELVSVVSTAGFPVAAVVDAMDMRRRLLLADPSTGSLADAFVAYVRAMNLLGNIREIFECESMCERSDSLRFMY